MPNIDISNFYFHRTPTIDGSSHVSIRKSSRKDAIHNEDKGERRF
jgi:hypothetical protein